MTQSQRDRRVTFAERLHRFPIILEVVPPHRRASENVLRGLIRRVQAAVKSIPHLDAVNLPEVLDENHVGLPFYRNLDPREFARRLNDGSSVETIVNKVVVHLESERAFRAYLHESTGSYGLRNFVLVGGTSSHNSYPGPDVVSANRILQETARGHADLLCGNITIPERPGEVDRLVRKTQAGGRFFTTQVLFEPEPAASVLTAYGEACAAAGVKPATVLLSFAPVADYEDIEFLVWLGATITPETEDALLDHRNRETGIASLDVARSIWARIRNAMARAKNPVPLGVNIEEISVHNFDLAVRMAQEFPAWRGAT